MKPKPHICAQPKFRLLNAEQEKAWDALERNEVTFLVGPAGSGKTQIAVAYAMKALAAGKVEKVILTRPVVEAGEKLGFLPGTFTEKIEPYMQPLWDCLQKVMGRVDRSKLNIEVIPLAYCRGRTFCDAVCILDEAQNATYMQLKMFLTRMGKGAKIILTGDPNQSDINGSAAFGSVAMKLQSVPGICLFQMTEASIVRHPLVAEMVKLL